MPHPQSIHLRGVRVHNLKNVDVDIPLRGTTVISGVSGAGKSSLAFNTLYAEAQRRYLQSFSAYTRQFLERLDQPDADQIENLPPAIAVHERSAPRGARATVGTITDILDYLRLLFVRAGMIHCPECGQVIVAYRTEDVIQTIREASPGQQIAIAFPSRPDDEDDRASWMAGLREEGFLRIQIGTDVLRLEQAVSLPEHDTVWVLVDRIQVGSTPVERLTDSIETAFSRGHGRMALLIGEREKIFGQKPVCPRCELEFPELEPRLFSFNDPLGACSVCSGTGETDNGTVCPGCKGTRLGDLARSVRLAGKNIAELSALTLEELATFCDTMQLPETAAQPEKLLVEQIQKRLVFLRDVGVGYLTLDRAARTLSTGEAQRVRLATALSSNLVSALYVLDEPTIGLHPRDTEKLLKTLRKLQDAGNTLVIVEHDPQVLLSADHVIDLGPGAGEEGGEVLYQGPPAELARCDASITGNYLAGRRLITVPSRRRPLNHGALRIVRARTNNLQDLTVEFPLGVLCVITGVSGAGKSSLVHQTLYPALCKRKNKKPQGGLVSPDVEVIGAGQVSDVVLMDQTPLGRTARSNPATLLKVFDDIRQLFADTTEARIRNFGPGHFSFNQPGGRCESCEGQGTLTVDMQFLADVTTTCPECHGTRFKPEILNVKVRSLNIAEVLNLTAREAFRFFRAQGSIERRLKWLLDVGLDYLRLGQPADTLSGGESQRLKLAAHLAGSRKARCLFILLEPTAGLHPADVVRLLDCFNRLLDTGHSIIVVEHNLDVIKCADHIIDLGPGAAAEGGRIVASGTPESVSRVSHSFTGQALKRVLCG